jgi:hypothetical protein
VQAYFKNITLPKTADDEPQGKLIAMKNCPFNFPFEPLTFLKLAIIDMK